MAAESVPGEDPVPGGRIHLLFCVKSSYDASGCLSIRATHAECAAAR